MKTAPTLDVGRLRRALLLDVKQLGPGHYRVTGGREPHHVVGRTCDCADSVFSGEVCKHRLSVHLHQRLHPSVRATLRALVEP